jgi:S1-C subfamily serine protease
LTEGVVSRVDVQEYAHSHLGNLLVQTDAAINSGDSGGPVLSAESGLVLGVATQMIREGSGLGYFIPTAVVRQFLADVADGKVDGISNLGIIIQTLRNDHLRASLGMRPEHSGVRVAHVNEGGSAEGIIRVDDVILEIDGKAIQNDGEVGFAGVGTLPLGSLFASKQVGETIPVKLMRDGSVLLAEVPLKGYTSSVVPLLPAYDEEPRYLIYAGLVILVVEPRYLELYERDEIEIPATLSVYTDRPRGWNGLKELVVISRVLGAPINKGYGMEVTDVRIVQINGRRIYSFDDVEAALAPSAASPQVEIELETGLILRFSPSEVDAADAAIREQYGVR